jgi:hypothetical protein
MKIERRGKFLRPRGMLHGRAATRYGWRPLRSASKRRQSTR